VRLGDDGYLAARQIVDNANTKAKIKRYAEAKRQA
jgi:hypothetical protein